MNYRYLHYLTLFSVYFLVIFLMMVDRNFLTTNDDAYFSRYYQDYDSLYKWIIFRYNAWSGRIAIEAVLPLVLKSNVWIWRLLNVSAFLLMLYSIFELAKNNKRTLSITHYWLVGLFVPLLVFITKRDVLEFGMFWATGSINYLWPTACLCFALIPFSYLLSGKQIHPAIWLISFPFAFFASFQEQTSLILICFALCSLCVYRLSYGQFCICGTVLFFINSFNFCILFTAPGNYSRMQEEVMKFYPNFNSISFFEKAYYGANYTLLNHWLYDSVKHLLVVVLLTYLISTKRTGSQAVRLLAFFPLCYVLLCILFARGIEGPFARALNLDIYGTISELTATLPVTLHIAPIVLGCAVLLLIPVLWVRIFTLQATLLKLLLFYFAGIFSSYMISFSPTVFASGYRVFFVPDIMMIIVAALLFTEGLNHFDIRSRSFICCYSFLFLAGLTRIISAII